MPKTNKQKINWKLASSPNLEYLCYTRMIQASLLIILITSIVLPRKQDYQLKNKQQQQKNAYYFNI